MTLRPTYEHHEGRIYESGRVITAAKAVETLDAHRLGARRSHESRWPKAAELSERFVAELEHAIRAAEIFNRVAKPSPDHQRRVLAEVRRTRKARHQAKGMTA